MKKAIIPAFLLVLGSTVLGATVSQERLAWAAPPLPSVFVANDAASPVPAREQNVDADGNIKVHEQGTADVNVTNTSLPVASPEPISSNRGNVGLSCPAELDLGIPEAASVVQIAWSNLAGGRVRFRLGESAVVAEFLGPLHTGDRHLVLPLTRAVAFDRIDCGAGSLVFITWIGNGP
jgi:hypothetical protein